MIVDLLHSKPQSRYILLDYFLVNTPSLPFLLCSNESSNHCKLCSKLCCVLARFLINSSQVGSFSYIGKAARKVGNNLPSIVLAIDATPVRSLTNLTGTDLRMDM